MKRRVISKSSSKGRTVRKVSRTVAAAKPRPQPKIRAARPPRPSPLLKVYTHPGIGDFSWTYSKLVTLGRPLEIVYCVPGITARQRNQAVVRRCEPFLGLLPAVKKIDLRTAAPPRQPRALSRELLLRANSATVLANSHLERGHRLETFLPDVETDFHYPIEIPPQAVAEAEAALAGRQRPLVIYMSSRRTNSAWAGWSAEQWAELVRLYRAEIDDAPVVVLGAEYDLDQSTTWESLKVPNSASLVGRLSLGASLEVLRRSQYFAAFPSGLPVLATVLKKPVYMFYPGHLEKMIPTWAPPWMIESGAYQGSLFLPPREAFARMREFLKSAPSTACPPPSGPASSPGDCGPAPESPRPAAAATSPTG